MSIVSSDCEESGTFTSSSIHWSQTCRMFRFADILLATENFNESLVIGSGGFGKVYKGIIESTNVVAAIKRLDLLSDQGAAEFWAEVEMLSKLRHCHLVSLIGYCNHEKEMILVYEYMSNGTLEDHLHKHGTPLSWLQRLKICIGAARGLDYLHTGTGIEFGVIHRDVKSSNILLDENWAAKVSDFGLSRISPRNQPSTYVNTLIKGTFGYLDPNYFATGRLTRKSDVYAFGVVLLEVLCRKTALDRSLEWGLATWAQDSIKEGNLKNIVDSDIRDEISTKCLKEFVRITNRCLDNHPKHRPTMVEVIYNLEFVMTLQEKNNTSLQTAGKTIFGKIVDKFPFPSNGGNSGMGFGFRMTKKEKMHTLGGKSFEEHGALFLKDELKNNSRITASSLKKFRAEELEEATNNFAGDLIIGRGGYGRVYKGILPDSRVVAIKKSILLDETHCEQIIHEIEILAQINHKNVVQLLGYCLETTVPLLVYEFVFNATLFHHIHNRTSTRLSWDNRLRIAHESAGALAYVHTMSIIHRDVKSSNILLDENYAPKLADFGASKLLPLGHDHIDTPVHGTLGYLDPECFNTGQVTDKSDVYSFGVVLAELLTGERPFDMNERIDDSHLAIYFVRAIKENRLPEIVEREVLKEATDEQLKAACDLVCRCLNLVGGNRPSMLEVTMELETLRKFSKNACVNQDNYHYNFKILVNDF